jgi:NYN domain
LRGRPFDAILPQSSLQNHNFPRKVAHSERIRAFLRLNDSNRPAQLLFTASERFERVKATGFHNLFNRLTPIALGFLDAAATGAILSAAVEGTGLRYTPEAVKSVWSYLRGYPAQVQQVGAKCMDKLASKHRNIVIPQDVEEVAASLIEDSVLFDYQCNRETIEVDEAFVLEAIFRGQESIHGKERALGMGVPIAKLRLFAPAVEQARLPSAIANLRNHQVVVQEFNDKAELVIRVSGLLLELWLGRLRAVRGDLRPETFPEKRPSVLEAASEHQPAAQDRAGCALWIDFENVAKSDALRKRFLDVSVDPKAVTADFVERLEQACRRAHLVVKDRRVVAPWTIPELMPYMDAFAAKGFQPEICVAGQKNAADTKMMHEIQQKTSVYTGTLGIGTLLLITADNDFATTLSYAKTSGLRAMVWGAWQRPSRDLKTNADKVEDIVRLLYSANTTNSAVGQGAVFHSARQLDQAIRFALAPNGGDQWSHDELDKTEVAYGHNEQLCNWLGARTCDGESAKALLCPTSGRGWAIVPAYDEYLIQGQILVEVCRKLGIPLSCETGNIYRLPVQPGLPFLLSLADLYCQMAKCNKTYPPDQVKLSREKGVHSLSLVLRPTGRQGQLTSMDDFERRYRDALSGGKSGGHETARRLSSLRLASVALEHPASSLQQSFFNGVEPGTELVAVTFIRSPSVPAVQISWTTKEP